MPNARDTSRATLCAVCGEPADELHHWAPRGVFGEQEAERWPRSWLCAGHHQQWHNAMRLPLDPAVRLALEATKPWAGPPGATVDAPLTYADRCPEVKRKEHGVKRLRVSTWRCTLRVDHIGPHVVPGQAPWL